MSHTIKDLVTAYGNKVIDNRRYLHAHPELSFQETDTAHWIRERLAAAGIPILEGISGNSTVGYLIGSQPGPSIGLRADIDALGLTEESDFSFKSMKPGVMHACGHDAHTAVLMGVAEILAAHKDLIKGTVYFIFQQGEEFLPGGACTLVEEGIADKVDAFFAIHVDAERPFGSVDVLEGTRSAAIATFEITVTGKGGHGSTPHTANNPLLPASDLVDAISMIPAMKCGPLDNATVSVTYLHSGTHGVANVIPETAVLGGAVRVLDTQLRSFVTEEIKRLGETIPAAYACSSEVTIVNGYPAVVNAPTCVAVMQESAREIGLEVAHIDPRLGGEDFAYYGMKKPAAIAWFGMADATGKYAPTPHHNPKFRIDDETGLPAALEYMLTVYTKACNAFIAHN